MIARVLGIDVSGPGGGAALWVGGEVRTALLGADVPRGRDLMPRVERLLAEAGLAPEALDGVACGIGPGSFTGIRIGIATAATLAWAAGLPVAGVGSLDGIAANAPSEAHRILVALDARRGRLFCGRFERAGEGPAPLGDYACETPEEAVAGLPADAWVLGDGRLAHASVLGAYPGAAQAPVRPDAIARIGAERFARGELAKPEELRPCYLRLSDPEIRRRQREADRRTDAKGTRTDV